MLFRALRGQTRLTGWPAGRRRLSAALAIALVPVAFPFAAGMPDRSDVAARPNILLLETDDQTTESLRVMSNVRRLLVQRGTTFSNNFASWPLCCPSRATVLTGQYAHNHRVLGNAWPNGGYYKLDSSNTLPVWLHDAGYRTAHLGKYLNQYGTRDPTEIPPGWDEWQASVDPTTYQYRDFTLNENGELHRYVGPYQTDVYADKAVDMVRRSAQGSRPFFAWIAFTAPHFGGPTEPDDPDTVRTPAVADRHRDAFADEPLPPNPSFDEADVSDKPSYVQALPRFGGKAKAAIRENYQQGLEALLAVDEAIGRILRELDRTGDTGRTLVVFTCDNGYFYGEHRVPDRKRLPYDPAARVPLVLRGPGVPAGVARDQLVANIDLAPTFVQAAGAEPRRVTDGIPLQPLARNASAGRARAILLEGLVAVGYGVKRYAAIRTPRYFYAEYDYLDGRPRENELYDLRHDPYQLESRHADPRLAGVRADLAARLTALRYCAGDGCR